MTYIPRRDYRFEYVGEAMVHIENKQCLKCIHKMDDPDYPMCFDVGAFFFNEEPVPMVDDLGDAGLNCRKFVLDTAYIDPVD